MPGRVGEHTVAIELFSTERKDMRSRDGDVLDHDVEVQLLRDHRARPGRSAVIGRTLKGQPGRCLILGNNDEIVTVVGNRVAEQLGVEPGESPRVGQSKMRWCSRPRTPSSSHRWETLQSRHARPVSSAVGCWLWSDAERMVLPR